MIRPGLLQAPFADTRSNYPLGKHIKTSTALFTKHGWDATVRRLRTPVDFPQDISQLPHKAARVLNTLRRRGAPIVLHTKPWTKVRQQAAMSRGPHKSADEYSGFLNEEMAVMAMRGQWMVLPYSAVKDIPGLRISPIGVVPQHDRRP